MSAEHRAGRSVRAVGAARPRRGQHRAAIAAAASTFFLLFVGGSVTSNDAGMAVPDWPTTFGQNMFLYPPSKWVGGVLFEHGHRLTGAAVGLLMIVLAFWTWRCERRRWVRTLAWVMLGAVVVQGVLGGLRVTERSIALAIVHGCFAQLFFCTTVCMVLFTSRSWMESSPAAASSADRVGRSACLVTSVAIFGQLIVGAVYRHLGAGLVYHVIGAAVITLLMSAVAMWISGEHGDRRLLMRLVKLMGGLLVIQLALGVGAYLAASRTDGSRPATLLEWFVPSLHVVVGASILAVSVALTASVSSSSRSL